MRLFLETISLQTKRGRLLFAFIANVLIFVAPYSLLSNLSLYKHLGLTWMPSIGLTRAYWHLLHGHLAAAWERNWLIFPVMMVAWSIVALDIYRSVESRETKRPASSQ